MRTPIRPSFRLAATLVVAVAAASPAPPAGAQPPPPFEETIEVQVVDVDVYVTDGDGNPVRGLTADDFVVLEDGRRMEITNFRGFQGPAVDAGAPSPGEAVPGEADEPEPGEAEAPAPGEAPPGAASDADAPSTSPRLLLYVDTVHLTPAGRKRAMEGVRDLLDGHLDGDVALQVVVYDGGVRSVTPFTRDPEEIRAALAELDRVPVHGIRATAEWSRTIDLMRDLYASCGGRGDPCTNCWEEMAAVAEGSGQQAEVRVRGALAGLGQAVAGLGGVEGRRALLYLSEGLDLQPAAGAFQYLAQLCPGEQGRALQRAGERELSRLFDDVAAVANIQGVTLYSVDAAGMRSGSAGSVEFANLFFRPSTLVDRVRTSSLQDGLFALAEPTGGRTLVNANRLGEALAEIADDFDASYSIGYSPDRPPDGELHRIEVRLADPRPGWRVRHREVYRDKSREAVLADQALAALLLDVESNPLSARIAFGETEKLARRRYRVPLRVTVPLGQLTFLPRGETIEGRLRLVVATRDARGQTDEVRQLPIPLRFPAAATAEVMARLHEIEIGLTLEGKSHEVVVGVVDDVGGEASYLKGAVEM